MEGGTSYSYSIINAAKIRADIQSIGETTGNSQLDHALADETWIDSMEGMKFGCQVADLVDGNFFDSSDEELLSSNGDGSSIWKLSSWIVNVDANGIPINISIPTTTSTSAEWSSGGGEYEIIASISGIEEITAATLPFETCDPESTDANESLEVTEASHERFLRILDAHDKSVSDEEYFEQEGKRRLDWTTDLQGWISNVSVTMVLLLY